MPFTAFFGAWAFPGLGHVLVGHVRRGIGWCALAWGLTIGAFASLYFQFPELFCAGLFAAFGIERLVEIIDAIRCGLRPRWHYGNRLTRGLLVLALWPVGYLLSYGSALVVRDQFMEAFRIAANSMMPTLLGVNVEGICTHCHRPTRLSANEEDVQSQKHDDALPDPVVGICAHCFAELSPKAYPQGPLVRHSPDKTLVNKRMHPHRWDLIVFRVPSDPTNHFAKRLVGLPGETVELRDGEVTINGKIVEKPPFLRGLRYANSYDIPGRSADQPGWGDTGRPARLGADEYFVLGDFSQRSRDSRLFESGAPGHPSYAVPADHIIGVVTQIYWPPDRWRTFERAE